MFFDQNPRRQTFCVVIFQDRHNGLAKYLPTVQVWGNVMDRTPCEAVAGL
jgi:hypothetical protein